MTYGQMMLVFPKSVLFNSGLTEVSEKLFGSHQEKSYPAVFIQLKTPLKQAISLPK